jgi:sugar/nucleoside kinase (ribokinase family)
VRVVLLHDFYVDHCVRLPGFDESIEKMREVHMRGGGNYLGVEQSLSQGGSATNTCRALRSLGADCSLVTKTSELGYALLKHFLKSADLSHVKLGGDLGLTTALEFGGQSNVMISHEGSNADFGFDDLDEEDLRLVERSDLLAMLNWSHNRKGTALIKGLLDFALEHKIKTFFDTNDPSSRKDMDDLRALVRHPGLKILGLNENELKLISGKDDIEEGIVALERHCRIDLHTKDFSYSLGKRVGSYPVSVKKLTGAGDHWSAADIYADLMGYPTEERLSFANAFAALYVSTGETPTLRDVTNFLEITKTGI